MRGWSEGRCHGGMADCEANNDVETLISAKTWLKLHGLKESKLSLSQILARIGFKHSDDYVQSLRKPIPSQYAEGRFSQFMKDGSIYNLIASPQELQDLCDKLEMKASLYQRRLDWLTSGSRQLFGVVQERSATLVLDFGRASGAQFRSIQNSVCLLLREQVSLIFRFNLIRASSRMEMWRVKAAPSSDAHIDSAVEWVQGLEPQDPPSGPDTAEALLKAMEDSIVEAVYLLSVGDFEDSLTDQLKGKLGNDVCPIHTVSFNAKKKVTIQILKELSQLTAGRFHMFAEMHTFRRELCGSVNVACESAKPIGGVPPGAGVREDVFLVWKEMEEAWTIRARLQAILTEIAPPELPQEPAVSCWSEDFLSSRVWLSQYGLKAQKLRLFDAFADCAFRHSDGVVDVKLKPRDERVQTDAEKNHMLVNAKYCNRFVHTRWRDGSLVHVYISAEKCRRYEERMKAALMNMQKRLEWLSKGSRELFGAISEERVYILLDTSESMKDQLPLVKDKIQQLMEGQKNTLIASRLADDGQFVVAPPIFGLMNPLHPQEEQLRHKSQVNIAKFGSQVAAWREGLVDVTPQSLESAWSWVEGLQAGGSANTLDALRLAAADRGTQAVYLLTDGRQNQPTGAIVAPGQLRPPVPVHVISFNCSDPEASSFLYNLAQETGGRYHCFPRGPQEPGAPVPYVSEDVHLLEEEIRRGEKDLESVLKLRAECVMLDWYHNGDSSTTKRTAARPHSAPWRQKAEKPPRPRSALEFASGSRLRPKPRTPATHCSSSQPPPPRRAGQTKASLLRLLTNGISAGDSGRGELQEWMLPETLSLYKTNTKKQKHVLNRLELTPKDDSQKKAKRKAPKDSLSMSSACWLRTNSLAARRLTIIDALAPTAITQSAKFVPVLEKHVYSKVFEEVFPLAHISGSTGRLTLVNPQAVDLEHYKLRVQRALEDYQRRLDLIVWKALTQEERDKFGSDNPVKFQEHREALLQALERLDWPLLQEDVSLLEDQISMGLTFLQQASDLQQAAKQTSATGGTEKKIRSPLSGVQKAKPKRALDTLRGQSVLARSEADGFYYPGTVRKRLARKRVFVDFASGDSEVVHLRSLVTVGGAAPCPPLRVGDFVLVGSGTEGTGKYFVPGVVIATPRRLELTDKLYTVLIYDSGMVHTLRSNIVKISQTRYDLTCQLLRERRREQQRAARRRRAGSASRKKSSDRKSSRTERRRKSRPQEVNRAVSPPGPQDPVCDTGEGPESRQDGSCDGRDSLEDESRRRQSSSSSSSSSSSQPQTPTVRQEQKSDSAKQAPAAGPPAADRMESLAQDLLLALEQHRGQQEEIQQYIRALSLNRLNDDEDDGQEEHRERTNQEQQALEKLQDLIPPHAGPANQDKEGDPGGVPEYVKTARLIKPKVSPGQEVLARWAHDGWYYDSSVVHACGDQSYFLQDREGALERVWREDIIPEGEDSSQEIKVDDPVIGAHPVHPNRYCPGVVLSVTEELHMKVRYYDSSEALLSWTQLFLIPAEKFESDVAYILECEERWVGQLVVARRDNTGTYHPAEVCQRVGNGQQYLIRWADGTDAVQDREWIFGRWSRTRALSVGDYALALTDPASLTFMPGLVQGLTETLVHIQFIDNQSLSVEAHHCFWLSEEQFNMAASLYASQQWCRTVAEEEADEEEEEDSRGDDSEMNESLYSTDLSSSDL